mmetsp:Transcript_93594/g.165610  ORF Transcript_93594/g.165610 Transcript_93594/m.165610 type:complete len:216 (-) Transcript_93594:239-886(-)
MLKWPDTYGFNSWISKLPSASVSSSSKSMVFSLTPFSPWNSSDVKLPSPLRSKCFNCTAALSCTTSSDVNGWKKKGSSSSSKTPSLFLSEALKVMASNSLLCSNIGSGLKWGVARFGFNSSKVNLPSSAGSRSATYVGVSCTAISCSILSANSIISGMESEPSLSASMVSITIVIVSCPYPDSSASFSSSASCSSGVSPDSSSCSNAFGSAFSYQ